MDGLPAASTPDKLAFDCPRCNTAVEERFYGACEACRTELRTTMRLQPREVVVAS